jgi:hypothetical protein
MLLMQVAFFLKPPNIGLFLLNLGFLETIKNADNLPGTLF